MAKKSMICILLVVMLSLTGCASKSLTYNANLGYDFSKMEYSELVFKVYHSNTERITGGKRLRKCRALLQKATLQI